MHYVAGWGPRGLGPARARSAAARYCAFTMPFSHAHATASRAELTSSLE